jgi:PiT family inorganic phosphate transporter
VVILAASSVGYPLSTTHVISGGITGAGAAKSVSAVRWGVAGDIVRAWVLTLPAVAGLSALVYGVTRLFGSGALGPVVVAAALLVGGIALFARRAQPRVAPPVTQ